MFKSDNANTTYLIYGDAKIDRVDTSELPALASFSGPDVSQNAAYPSTPEREPVRDRNAANGVSEPNRTPLINQDISYSDSSCDDMPGLEPSNPRSGYSSGDSDDFSWDSDDVPELVYLDQNAHSDIPREAKIEHDEVTDISNKLALMTLEADSERIHLAQQNNSPSEIREPTPASIPASIISVEGI